MVKHLIKSGAMINAIEHGNITPLHWAARNGRMKCVNILMENGANIESKTNLGCTVLHLAAESGNVELLDYFYMMLNDGLAWDIDIIGKFDTYFCNVSNPRCGN